jgi:hypothetical protein
MPFPRAPPARSSSASSARSRDGETASAESRKTRRRASARLSYTSTRPPHDCHTRRHALRTAVIHVDAPPARLSYTSTRPPHGCHTRRRAPRTAVVHIDTPFAWPSYTSTRPPHGCHTRRRALRTAVILSERVAGPGPCTPPARDRRIWSRRNGTPPSTDPSGLNARRASCSWQPDSSLGATVPCEGRVERAHSSQGVDNPHTTSGNRIGDFLRERPAQPCPCTDVWRDRRICSARPERPPPCKESDSRYRSRDPSVGATVS